MKPLKHYFLKKRLKKDIEILNEEIKDMENYKKQLDDDIFTLKLYKKRLINLNTVSFEHAIKNMEIILKMKGGKNE